MDIVNNYFKKKTDEIIFIELKEDANIKIEGYPEYNIPLPLMTKSLVKEINESNLEEEIDLSYILEGIVFLIGIAPEFKYVEEYKDILVSYGKQMEDYIFHQGIKFMEKQDYDNGAIYFRTLKSINERNIDGIFNYGLALEGLASKFFSIDKKEEGTAFITKATITLESILDIDESYPLTYYKLGYHYRYFEQYLKAKLIWSKYLLLDDDQLRIQEIRGEIESIEDNVAIESALTYLHHDKFSEALDIFLKLLPKFKEQWEIKYLIGLCYKGLADYEVAIDYFYDSLDDYKMNSETYNELGICLFTIGDIEKAIGIFTLGLEKISDDYRLLFNRGLGYLQLGKLKEAYTDIDKACKLNPGDENMKAQKQLLEEQLQ